LRQREVGRISEWTSKIAKLEEQYIMKETKEQLTSIGEIAKELDMSQRTIRYYEEIGLLNSIKRVEAGRRVYTDMDLRRLKLIKRLKIMGMTLSEMQELEAMWTIEKSTDKVLGRLLELMSNQLRRLDDRIADLNILRNEIVEYQKRIKSKIGK
jgi:MerR family transcriptional regulator, repressor of the yfmOP operon